MCGESETRGRLQHRKKGTRGGEVEVDKCRVSAIVSGV